MSEEISTKDDVNQVQPKRQKYPVGVYFVLANISCERFAFYSIQALLSIYLTNELLYNASETTAIFHGWKLVSYFFPILGAILGDSRFGKFRSIFYFTIFYLAGTVVLTSGTFKNELVVMRHLSVWGLMMVGCGTGIIKPCVTAFGADQFKVGQEAERKRYFSMFYFMVNIGSLLSTVLAPLLRKQIHCMGEESCYPLAFGIPAVLMLVSIIWLAIGKPFYRSIDPDKNVLLLFPGCICHAICKRMKTKERTKDHWLDYADDKYDKKFIRDAKYVFGIWFIMLPLPLFWALYDQQGSRWTLQATKLDGRLNGFEILPDQMNFFNPVFVLLFIPLFDYVVYPACHMASMLTKPLHRVTTGGILAALAFLVAGFLELKIEKDLRSPEPYRRQLCFVNLTEIDVEKSNFSMLDKNGAILNNWRLSQIDCDAIQALLDDNYISNTIADSGEDYNKEKIPYNKPDFFTFSDHFSTLKHLDNASIHIFNKMNNQLLYEVKALHDQPVKTSHAESTKLLTSNFKTIRQNVTYDDDDEEDQMKTSLSIFLMVPQYAIMTMGEILFSISGLDFSYSQAPLSMKSVVQASWLLTTAFGNLLVVIISRINKFGRQSIEFFIYAALMAVDMLIFGILAHYYKYVEIESEEEIVVRDDN